MFAACNRACGARGCWDDSSDACQRCSNSTTYLLNYSCVSTCPDGYFPGSLDPLTHPNDTYACIPCDSSCKTCTGPSARQCVTCPSGVGVRVDGSCGFCDMLVDGFLLNGTCSLTCPDGMWADGDTVACLPCSSNCSLCSGGSRLCTACNPGSYLSLSTCYTTCPRGQYGINGSWTCSDCSEEVNNSSSSSSSSSSSVPSQHFPVALSFRVFLSRRSLL